MCTDIAINANLDSVTDYRKLPNSGASANGLSSDFCASMRPYALYSMSKNFEYRHV
jgi:hypothetical protein